MDFERPDIIRPPSEAGSYFLPLTSGCSNNSCVFCNYYGCKLNLRAIEDVIKEIDALALYLRRGLRAPGMPPIMYIIGGIPGALSPRRRYNARASISFITSSIARRLSLQP